MWHSGAFDSDALLIWMSLLYSGMTTRLQVLLDDEEFEQIKSVAKRHRLTVAEWVRQALRQARRDEPVGDARRKLTAVREAAQGDYPTADIDRMLTEIEGGYLVDEQ